MSFYSKYLLLPTVVCRLRKNAKAGFISEENLAHKFVLESARCSHSRQKWKHYFRGVFTWLNLFLVSPLLFTTKKMPLNLWNGRNIKHCILRKKIQIEQHLCPLSSSNNNSHYNDGINTWRTEKKYFWISIEMLDSRIYMNNKKLSKTSLSFLLIVKNSKIT